MFAEHIKRFKTMFPNINYVIHESTPETRGNHKTAYSGRFNKIHVGFCQQRAKCRSHKQTKHLLVKISSETKVKRIFLHQSNQLNNNLNIITCQGYILKQIWMFFCNLPFNMSLYLFTLHLEYIETTSKLERIEFHSHVKFLNLLVWHVEFIRYDFCVPKRVQNATDNHFPNFETRDGKDDTMGRRRGSV